MMSETQKDSGYLIFDWRKGKIRDYHQTKNADLAGNEIRVPVEVKAETPEIAVQSFAAEINVTEGDVRAVLGEELVDDPELRLEEMPNPTEVVFSLGHDDYRERLDNWIESEREDYNDPQRVEDMIDWFRGVIATEHKEMNRPNVLDHMEEKLDELKEMRD